MGSIKRGDVEKGRGQGGKGDVEKVGGITKGMWDLSTSGQPVHNVPTVFYFDLSGKERKEERN